MKLVLVLCLVAGLAPAAGAQKAKEFSGKVAKIETDSVELKDKQGAVTKFKIGSKLLTDANLRTDQEVTAFYKTEDGKLEITALRVGEVMWHARQCSRDDCACTNYKCKPSCKCKNG